MKAAKKQRLKAAGWKQTSVQKFLKLSKHEAESIEKKLKNSRTVTSTLLTLFFFAIALSCFAA